MKLTISKKLFLFFVLPGLLLFSFFVFFSIQKTEKIMYNLHEQVFSKKIENSASLINVLFTEAAKMLETTGAEIENEKHLSKEKLIYILQQNIKYHKFIFGSTVAFEPYAFNPDKKRYALFTYRTENGLTNINLDFDYTSNNKWYSIPKETGKPYWTEPYLSPIMKNVKFFSYCIPLKKNGKFIGVLTIDVALELLQSILQKYLDYESKMYAIISPTGRFITHFSPDKSYYHTVFDSTETSLPNKVKNALKKAMKEKKSGFNKILYKETGDYYWVFYAPISRPNWTILVYANEKKLNGPIKDVFYEALISFAFITIVAVVLFLFIVKNSVKPVLKLRKISQQIRQGNYDIEFNVNSSDEIGELADDLNNMSKQLAIREKELLEINQTLEEKIKKRTIELQKAKESTDKIIDNSLHPIAVTEKDTGKVLRANKALAKVHRVPLKKIYKSSALDWYWNKNDKKKLIKIMAEKGKIINFELEGKRLKDGKKRWLLISLFPTLYLNKDAFVIEFIDITDSKMANLRIQKQNLEIRTRNKHISDNINYAQRIQESILPTEEQLSSFFPEYFLLYMPKDIVSGDFYWVNKIGSKKIIAVVDCTGHGVSGALMSMIGNTVLNEIITLKKITDPAVILTRMNKKIIYELNKNVNNQTYDGMDIALCVIDEINNTLEFAGAYRPLLYFKDNTLFEIKGTRKSIGDIKKNNVEFVSHKIDLNESVIFYLFSDGYEDQNNSQNKKFGSSKLKETLKAIRLLPLKEQRKILFDKFKAFQGDEIQRDDITIIGIKPLSSIQEQYENIIEYRGQFSHKTIFNIGENIKEKLSQRLSPRIVKTIYFCAMELMQNIGFYAVEQKTSGIGKFNIKHFSKQNFILLETSNRIKQNELNVLINRLDNLNSLTTEELKELYKKMLKSQLSPNHNSGGVGLIQIIRKTKNKIDYTITNESHHISTITLKVKIFTNNT